MFGRTALAKLLLFVGMCILSLSIVLFEGIPVLAATQITEGGIAQQNVGKTSSSAVITQQQAQKALAFWTPERMRAAVPIDTLIKNNVSTKQAQSTTASKHGSFKTVAPAIAPHLKQSAVSTPNEVSQPKDYSYPFPFKRFEVTADYTQWPYSTLGRIFFNTPDGGSASCSGSSINSNNKSVVETTGHCVIDGGSHNGWFTNNWIFCPSYKDGNGTCTHGTWAARQLWSRTEWTDDHRLEFDLGEAVMWDNNGQKLVDAVGGQGGAWNYDHNQFYYAFGYPGASPFTGERLIECDAPYATTQNPDGLIGLLGPYTTGIGCDMTEGSSGGPWIINFGKNGGYINGHVSYTPNDQPLAIYSPYYGNEAYDMYQHAENA